MLVFTTPQGQYLMSHLDDLFEGFPERMDTEDVTQLFGITQQAVYQWLKDGTIPAYRVGRRWIILRDEVKAAVEAGSNAAAGRLDADEDDS